ncbi:hypothetical protein [Paraburkholderia sp. BCC1876]|uniref:hypothetical protein n=1 Tax=Paraburkholderia sp. BCC1876 TaxID=2676303 RepID=UPI001591ED07|nr:hypothetical protein [Paraburkholderia sp. BCC1876]
MHITFFTPYLLPLYGAAWNIQQSLEGLGVSSSYFVSSDPTGPALVSSWSPGVHVMAIFGLLFVAMICVFICVLWAGYILARKKGALVALAVIILPGVLNMVGLWPIVPSVPDTFVIDGTGVLGSGWGMLPLVCLGATAGWCLLLIYADLFSSGSRFWLAYDHVWYVAGLLAGIVFVADSQVSEHARRLQESSQYSRQASAYLRGQTAAYEQWCEDNGRVNQISCRWASTVQQKLLDYSWQEPALFWRFGPTTSAEVYSIPRRNITERAMTQIRLEIAAYNRELCPVADLGHGVQQLAAPSRHCLTTPANFSRAYHEPLDGKVNNSTFQIPLALDSEGIIPTLVMYRTEQEALWGKVEQDRRTKHFRWIYYLLFSLVIGGKIAGATTKLAAIEKRSPQELRRSSYLFRSMIGAICNGGRFTMRTASKCLRGIVAILAHLLRRIAAACRRLLAIFSA